MAARQLDALSDEVEVLPVVKGIGELSDRLRKRDRLMAKSEDDVAAASAYRHIAIALELQILHDGTASRIVGLSAHTGGEEAIVNFLLRLAECGEVFQ
jgi:hypothetical protein